MPWNKVVQGDTRSTRITQAKMQTPPVGFALCRSSSRTENIASSHWPDCTSCLPVESRPDSCIPGEHGTTVNTDDLVLAHNPKTGQANSWKGRELKAYADSKERKFKVMRILPNRCNLLLCHEWVAIARLKTRQGEFERGIYTIRRRQEIVYMRSLPDCFGHSHHTIALQRRARRWTSQWRIGRSSFVRDRTWGWQSDLVIYRPRAGILDLYFFTVSN